MPSRLAACATATLAMLALAGPAVASPSPFREIVVERRDRAYVISWRAQAERVSVHASRRPDTGFDRRVGQGGGRGRLRLTRLSERGRWYFRLLADGRRAVVVAERALHLATAPNARDLGGYRTTDGRWVRPGVVIRSSSLSALSAADQAALRRLGIRTDIDLRTEDERKRQPDRVPTSWRIVHADMFGPDAERDLGRSPSLEALVAEEQRLYRERLVASPTARRALRTTLRTIASARARPLIFHDSGGSNRTGWAAYVLLRVLDVPHRVAVEDYLETNRYLDELLQQGLMLAPPQLHDYLRLKIRAGGAKREYLSAALQEVRRRYGSMAGYVRRGMASRRTTSPRSGEGCSGGEQHVTFACGPRRTATALAPAA